LISPKNYTNTLLLPTVEAADWRKIVDVLHT